VLARALTVALNAAGVPFVHRARTHILWCAHDQRRRHGVAQMTLAVLKTGRLWAETRRATRHRPRLSCANAISGRSTTRPTRGQGGRDGFRFFSLHIRLARACRCGCGRHARRFARRTRTTDVRLGQDSGGGHSAFSVALPACSLSTRNKADANPCHATPDGIPGMCPLALPSSPWAVCPLLAAVFGSLSRRLVQDRFTAVVAECCLPSGSLGARVRFSFAFPSPLLLPADAQPGS